LAISDINHPSMKPLPNIILRAALLTYLLLTIHFIEQLSSAPAPSQRPHDSFEYHHLQLTLEIPESENVIKGVATWQVSPLVSDLADIRFVTMRTDIKAVLVNEQPAQFMMRADTLLVELRDPPDQHVRFKVEIMYQSEPEFGLFRPDSNLIRSSLNPGSSKALMPVLINKYSRVPTDIRVMVAHDWQAVSNGRLLANILLPENKRIYHWRSERPVSIDDISLAAGKLVYHQQYPDSHTGSQITLHYRSYDLNEQDYQRIFQTSKDVVAAAERVMDQSLPFGNLNLIYLPDHLWDTRSSVSAFGYIYGNGADIQTQIIRNVAYQYFGAAKTGNSIQAQELTLALQAVLAGKISRDLGIKLDFTSAADYPSWSTEVWNVWSSNSWLEAVQLEQRTHQQRGLYTRDQLHAFELLRSHLRAIFKASDETYSWAEILQAFSTMEQIPWPRLSLPDDELIERYTLIYVLDEETSRFQIELIPDEQYDSRNLQLQLRMFVDGAVTDRELLISNQGDRIQLSPHGWVENMYLVDSDESMIFTEIKPASFWLYQLRRDSDPLRRIESAQGFGRVRDDPDVQLILLDLVRNEPDEFVRAYLVESLAAIVGGAFGTHQRFVDLLRDPSMLVRNAALQALSNYNGSEAVQRELFRIISQSQDIDFVNLAIGVYKQVVDQQEFYSVARGLLHEDLDELLFTESIIPLILKTEQGIRFAPNLLIYTDGNFPISLRLTVLDTLQDIEMDGQFWQDVLPELVTDSDPRIRYHSLYSVGRLQQRQRDTLLTDRAYNEFDLRILEKVFQITGAR